MIWYTTICSRDLDGVSNRFDEFVGMPPRTQVKPIHGQHFFRNGLSDDRLTRREYDLLLVARRQERMRSLAEKIGASPGREVETLSADLREDGRITMLADNAGVGANAPLLQSAAALQR